MSPILVHHLYEERATAEGDVSATADTPTGTDPIASRTSPFRNERIAPQSRLRTVVPAVHDRGAGVTRIAGIHGEYVVADPTGRVLELLGNFSGFQPLEAILMTFREDWDRTELVDLVTQLVDGEVLVPATDLWRTGHRAGQNPLTLGEVLRGTELKDFIRLHSWRRRDQSAEPSSGLVEIAMHRKSVRSFRADGVVPIPELSQVLRTSYSAAVAAVPSAGGLRSCEIRVLVRVNDTWELRLWDARQSVLGISLDSWTAGNSDLAHALDCDIDSMAPQVVLVILMSPDLHVAKYGNRGYRYSILEAGHVAQMVHLAATEAGIAGVEWGAFRDEELRDLICAETGWVPATCILLGLER